MDRFQLLTSPSGKTKRRTYRIKHKDCPTFLMSSCEGYESTRFFARRMGTKAGLPLISFKAVKRGKRGRFK